MAINLDDITELYNSNVFRLDELNARAYEGHGPSIVASLSFEMNPGLYQVIREGYTFMDILSDIGGVEAVLISVISMFLSFWNYKHFDNYMAKHLYKMNNESNAKENLDTPYFRNMKHFFMEKLPRRLVCCQRSKSMIALYRARKLMESEIDIISLIKSRRYMNAALRELLPKSRIEELKRQSYFITVDHDTS